MAKEPAKKISRAGAYIVKAAESRSTRVSSRSDGRKATPNLDDKRLAAALLKAKQV